MTESRFESKVRGLTAGLFEDNIGKSYEPEMIDADKLAKLNKLDEIDGLKTGLEEVKAQIKAFDTTLSQPVKIEDPVLIESGLATRNYCIQFAYIYTLNSYKILKRLQGDISGIRSDIEDIKTQLDEMRKPWWKKILTKKVIPIHERRTSSTTEL